MSSRPTALCPCNPARAERGFGVVELVVVLLIIAIVLGLLITTFRGSKRTSSYKVAQAAASNYVDAIEAYMADNGQTPPTVGSTAWPATPRSEFLRGPVDALLRTPNGTAKPYLRTVPEAVSSGRVDFLTTGAVPAPNAQATITYSTTASAYTLLVRAIAISDEPPLVCAFTNAPTLPAGTERC